MAYKEFIPGEALKQFVKCYYFYESNNTEVFKDKAFATGSIELMFNLGNGQWQTAHANEFVGTPAVELWGPDYPAIKLQIPWEKHDDGYPLLSSYCISFLERRCGAV